MKVSKYIFTCLFLVINIIGALGQCKHTLSINSLDASCNGNETSTVTINVTVMFGSGNNSATISYNIGAGEVVAVILEDDSGDIIDQSYTFMVPTCNNYSVTLTAWTNPSGSGSSCSDPPPVIAPVVLPVEFGDFTVDNFDSGVLVQWTTHSETNNEGFEIQHSQNNTEFKTVGWVPGAGDSHDIKKYRFEDQLNGNGIYYYRIKQIDLDGNFSYTDTRSISVRVNNKITIFPNPAVESLNVSNLSTGWINIHNSMGQKIKSIYVDSPSKVIDVSGLSSGVYYLWSDSDKESKMFIKK